MTHTLKLNPVSICQETRGPATPSRCRSDSMQGILAGKSICISRCQSRARGEPPLACSASVLLERGSVPKFDSGLRKASKFYLHKSSFDRRSPPLIQMFSSPYPSAAVKIIAAFLWELATRRKPVAISFP